MIAARIEMEDGKKYIYPQVPQCEGKRYIYWDQVQKNRCYEKILNKEPIAWNNICITEFSIREYRNIYGIEEDKIVEIYFDGAFDCFFCGNDGYALDFSSCKFIACDETAGIFFEDSIFYCGKVDFYNSQIGNFDFSMTNCIFIENRVEFTYSVFGDNDIYFNKTMLVGDECEINFSGTNFGEEGKLTFEYMKGMSGKVEFWDCLFGQRELDFSYMKCPHMEFWFWDLETSSMPVNFVDSEVGMIILYKVNINGFLDFRIARAEHIIIQESVIRDFVWLGNRGYKNVTCYSIKKSTLLGRLKIQNKFSRKLFDKQLQIVYDEINKQIVLCDTSSTDKANQLTVLAENYNSEGEADNADAAYVLSKRYRSRGRVHDIWTDYAAVGRTEEYKNSFLKRMWAYGTITCSLVPAIIACFFEKIFLDILCGNYATKPFKFLFWLVVIVTVFAMLYLKIDVTYFEMPGTIYDNMDQRMAAWIYSLQVFLQIDSGDLVPNVVILYYLFVVEKLVGLSVFSIFVVSYTRKVIK